MKSILLGLTIAIVISGCASGPNELTMNCTFPDSDTPAPGWICDEPVEGLGVQAIGIAEPSDAGISYMKDMAKLEARAEIANQLQTQISEMVKRYIATAGTGDSQAIDAVGEAVKKSVTNQSVAGSKIYKSRTGPNGRLYVLMGIDDAVAKNARMNAMKSSMKNDNALWQKFMAEKSFNELASEIEALSDQ